MLRKLVLLLKQLGDGVIKNAQYSSSYGNYIDIVHFNKYMTRYAHLNGFAKGMEVQRSHKAKPLDM